jgi:hypothetical protein
MLHSTAALHEVPFRVIVPEALLLLLFSMRIALTTLEAYSVYSVLHQLHAIC